MEIKAGQGHENERYVRIMDMKGRSRSIFCLGKFMSMKGKYK